MSILCYFWVWAWLENHLLQTLFRCTHLDSTIFLETIVTYEPTQTHYQQCCKNENTQQCTFENIVVKLVDVCSSLFIKIITNTLPNVWIYIIDIMKVFLSNKKKAKKCEYTYGFLHVFKIAIQTWNPLKISASMCTNENEKNVLFIYQKCVSKKAKSHTLFSNQKNAFTFL